MPCQYGGTHDDVGQLKINYFLLYGTKKSSIAFNKVSSRLISPAAQIKKSVLPRSFAPRPDAVVGGRLALITSTKLIEEKFSVSMKF